MRFPNPRAVPSTHELCILGVQRLTETAHSAMNGGMQTLVRRFRRSTPAMPAAPAAPAITVTRYTRVGCHLCDLAAKPVARLVAATPGATSRIVDVDTDPNLQARYGTRVPVVTATVRGQETVLAEGKVSEVWLRRALAALREA